MQRGRERPKLALGKVIKTHPEQLSEVQRMQVLQVSESRRKKLLVTIAKQHMVSVYI